MLTILPLDQTTADWGCEVLVSALVVCIVGGLGTWTGAIPV